MMTSTGISSYKSDLESENKSKDPCENHLVEWPENRWLPNEKYNEKLCAVRYLDRGGFGKVYLGHRKIEAKETKKRKCINEELAIKICETTKSYNEEKDKEVEKRLRTEYEVLKKLNGKSTIVRLIKRSLISDKDSKQVWVIAMEYCSNGNLNTYFKKKNIHEGGEECKYLAKKILHAVAEGLNALYEVNYFHRDIKKNNIFVTGDEKFKLGDFGLVASCDEPTTITCGTPTAMAPEMNGKNQYDKKVDIWSLGILLYKLLYGKNPFDPNNGKPENENATEIRRRSCTEKLKFPSYSVSVSEEARDLLNKMLEKDPTRRIDLNKIRQHPYLTSPSSVFVNSTRTTDSGFLTQSNISNQTNMTNLTHQKFNIKQNLKCIPEMNNGFIPRYQQQQRGVENMPVITPTCSQYQNFPRQFNSEPSMIFPTNSAMPSIIRSGFSKSKLLDPINTTRLSPSSSEAPKLKQQGIEKIEILDDGQVQLEYNRVEKKHQNGTITKLSHKVKLKITGNGHIITDLTSCKQHQYQSLPTDYYKWYNIAAKYVGLLRSKTAKITRYYTFDKEIDWDLRKLKGACSKLMENGNVEVKFYNQVLVNFDTSRGFSIKKGDQNPLPYESSTIEIQGEFETEWNMFKKIRKQLEFLAKICEDEENGQDLPITQGKRPK